MRPRGVDKIKVASGEYNKRIEAKLTQIKESRGRQQPVSWAQGRGCERKRANISMMHRRKSPLRRKSAEIETEGQVMAAIKVIAVPAAARTQVQVAAFSQSSNPS